MTGRASLAPVAADDLPVYPLTIDDRLDSHSWVVWERRRWLNSGMRLRGTPECRALYLDLIWIAFDQSPMGTLPDDDAMLAKILMVELGYFQQLRVLEYGPLHNWTRCLCGDEVRLMHPVVLATVQEAVSRREDNRARNEAANLKKRLQRLRSNIQTYAPEIAKDDGAVLWIDGWLTDQGCTWRSAEWHQRGLTAWVDHMRRRGMAGGRSG
jgi:hypothetical protein